MTSLAQLTKKRESFEKFIVARGAQVLQPTNEWEVLRFRTHKGVSVIYRNSKETLTFTGDSFNAWQSFEKGVAWVAVIATKRSKKDWVIVETLMKRDGIDCFFCWQEMDAEDRTLEHLVPLAHGGPNHISNLVLSHSKCNGLAGSKSVMEKIRIRESSRPGGVT